MADVYETVRAAIWVQILTEIRKQDPELFARIKAFKRKRDRARAKKAA